MSLSPMIDENARKTAANCRHYAMCKIDYLGTGVCASGPERRFVTFYPQGRMDLYRGLAEGLIPVTEALVESADSCTLCGICDKQCHFVTGMRPVKVMAALKDYVREHKAAGRPVVKPAEDDVLASLRAITGSQWASNDPAVLMSYADDPSPLTVTRLPRYVVLPGSTGETAAIVSLAQRLNIPFAIRGNGGSVAGFVFSDGIVMDMNRMQKLEIDADNWCARVGPGVTSFDLQQEAWRRGFRVNAAEPAATVCGNIVCTGTFSTWASTYGTGADNFIDMEFVDRKGEVFRVNSKGAPNVLAFENRMMQSPGVCTEAVVKLHPVTADEEAVLIPFADFEGAAKLARELCQRRLALAVAVLGRHYMANFIAPSAELADGLKHFLPEVLGIPWAVFAIADTFGREAIAKLAPGVIDAGTIKTMMLGLPRLLDSRFENLARVRMGGKVRWKLLAAPGMKTVLEAVLKPSPDTIASVMDEDLRDFYRELYARPEMTDFVWLNMFRIVSARMGRDKHGIAFIAYVPLDKVEVINRLTAELDRVAGNLGIDHAFGFLTPMDLGKRAILEYDYYFDHTDPEDRQKGPKAMAELVPWLDRFAAENEGVTNMMNVFSQGCSRKENFLYRA
jgi:hypothetical protein